MLAFLFAAALAVARIHASQMTMDAKIRDDSDLSQVKTSSSLRAFSRYSDLISARPGPTRRHVADMRHDYARVLEPSRRSDRARENCV